MHNGGMEDPIVARLAVIREREGLSTAAMARRIGVDQSYLHLVFRGDRGVGRKMLDGALAAFPELREVHAQALTISHADLVDVHGKRLVS